MNRKIDEIGKKNTNKIFALVLLIIVIVSVVGLIILSTFIGYVYQNYVTGRAGYIYELVLEYRECAYLWSGVFGAAVMVPGYNNNQDVTISSCGMYDANILFNCLQPNVDHVLMASQVPSTDIQWGSLEAATPEDVDNYLMIEGNNYQHPSTLQINNF